MLEWEKRSQRIDKKILNDHSFKMKWDLRIGEHIFDKIQNKVLLLCFKNVLIT